MYMNVKTYDLSFAPDNNLVEIDDLIAPAIQNLNRRGYYTSACCSGHIEEPPYAYIQFDYGEMTPEILPAGWYWEEDGLMYYNYVTDGTERKNEIHQVMDGLLSWSDSLPSAI